MGLARNVCAKPFVFRASAAIRSNLRTKPTATLKWLSLRVRSILRWIFATRWRAFARRVLPRFFFDNERWAMHNPRA